MGENIVVFLIGQSVVIVGAVLVSYINTKIAIAKLQVETKHITEATADLHTDHRTLVRKVDGISRQVVRMEGSRAR